MQVFICVGILVAYLVGLPYRNNMPQHAYIGGSDVAWWRIMLALGLIPAALQVLFRCISMRLVLLPFHLYYNLHLCWPECCCSLSDLMLRQKDGTQKPARSRR